MDPAGVEADGTREDIPETDGKTEAGAEGNEESSDGTELTGVPGVGVPAVGRGAFVGAKSGLVAAEISFARSWTV